jgi:arylsulfatase
MQSKGLDFGLAHPSQVEAEVGPPYDFPEAIKKLGLGEINRPLDWESLTTQQKEFQADKMAVHAGMVEAMDTEIGRILDHLKNSGRWENTLVMFLSDNGASAEIMVRGDGHNPSAWPGSPESYLCLGPGWSSVSNTPFRRHKTWVHEGGIATPMIVHWPAKIKPQDKPISKPYHVIDIVPTLYGLASQAGINANTGWLGPDLPGKSFAHEFDPSEDRLDSKAPRVLWWQHEGNRALRVGDLKIVAAGKDSSWELYNLAKDRAETENLAQTQPQDLDRLVNQWNELTEQFRKQAIDDSP